MPDPDTPPSPSSDEEQQPDITSPDQPNDVSPEQSPSPPEPDNTASTPPPSHQVTSVSSGSGGKKKSLISLLILIIIILVVAACFVIIKHHKKTVVSNNQDIPLLNVGFVDNSGVANYPVSYPYSNDTILIDLQLFEGLVGYQNGTKIIPLLATSWTNPNSTTWVFNLRHNVHFHSGRVMTAQDVVYSLNYAVAHQNEDGGGSTFFVVSDIKKVSATSQYQVTVTTTSPDAVLLNQLSLIGIVDSKARLGAYDAGTGPYIVKPNTTPTANWIDLVASNNYWGGHVDTRQIRIHLYANTDKLLADAASGKLDLAGEFNKSQLSKIKYNQLIQVPDQGLNYIGVNTERSGSPLESLAARQALAYALNIPAILKAGGLSGQQASQIVPSVLPGYNPSVTNVPYNPTKAKQLLSTVSGASQPLTFAYPNDDGPQVTEIAKELNAVGFNIKPVLVSNFNDFINDSLGGKYDLFTLSDTSATVDGLDILSDILEDNSDYDSKAIDSLVAQAGSTLNTSDRIHDMQQIATIVSDNKAIIPLYTQTRVYISTKPYVFNEDLPSLYTSTYFWKVHQN